MPGRDFVHADLVKQKIHHRLQRLGSNPQMPPGLTDTVSDFRGFYLVIDLLDNANGADRPDRPLFPYNRPLIIGMIRISFDPIGQHLCRHRFILMRRPG